MASLTPRVHPRPSLQKLSSTPSTTNTPAKNSMADADLEVGDAVTVPGGMDGTVKFVGEVKGRQGKYVGVELSEKWAARGKNNGDAEGIRYFSTSIPGSGIFLPTTRASKRASPTSSSDSIALTPTTPSLEGYSLHLQERGGGHTRTPPTPSMPSKFSQSLGPGRAPSPALRPRSRPSLPRPESPLRKAQNISTSTPAGRPSFPMLSHNRIAGARFAPSPTPGKFAGRTTKARDEDHSVPSPAPAKTNGRPKSKIRGEEDEFAQLRAIIQEKDAIIQEKNERIVSLTAEFDAHRADFRSTLDTLETASSETERVYEKRIDELLEERRVWVTQSEDVESVAHQLKQLEDVVQELEEGLEDARRGEAEARGEVEYLRGEVERERAEHRQHACWICNGGEPTRHREEDCFERPIPELTPGLSPANSDDLKRSVWQRRAAGQRSPDKWCALCEQDGHDSISCPLDRA